ncbi:hypothetical protein, partial [uncultured Rhodoblastus sp.]|uniref:hypothetical protein n=1 Tax=uncultured Rhodoblastus sp. TaxID=543037 RepID=UPI0025E286F1
IPALRGSARFQSAPCKIALAAPPLTEIKNQPVAAAYRLQLTPHGDGHAAFFRLARTLHWAGVTGSDLTQELRDQAAHAHSPQKRRAEINGIVKKLDQSGKIGGRKAA